MCPSCKSFLCFRFGETKSTFCTVASFKEEQVDNQALTLDLEEMIEDYNKKRQEELDKLREFTGKRSPVTIPGVGGYYKGLQPFQGNMNFQHNHLPPQHHHHHHHHSNKWKHPHQQHHTYSNGMNGRSKVFNGLHIFHHQGDIYGHQQHSSSDEESNSYQGGATTLFQAADYTATASTDCTLSNNTSKVVISSSSNNNPTTTQQHSIHVSSPAPVNMKTGHSSHISQPSSTAAQNNKPDRYRWVKGAEPVKA